MNKFPLTYVFTILRKIKPPVVIAAIPIRNAIVLTGCPNVAVKAQAANNQPRKAIITERTNFAVLFIVKIKQILLFTR